MVVEDDSVITEAHHGLQSSGPIGNHLTEETDGGVWPVRETGRPGAALPFLSVVRSGG
jgi:hypothetical protein